MNAHQPVIKREMLLGGPIVTVKIPGSASMKRTPGSGSLPYLHFPKFVKGGCINMHAHEGLSDCAGQTVRARCVVWKKTVDGREYLYIDLFPTINTVTTHELHILQNFDPEEQEIDGAEYVFATPTPLMGCVAFAKM